MEAGPSEGRVHSLMVEVQGNNGALDVIRSLPEGEALSPYGII